MRKLEQYRPSVLPTLQAYVSRAMLWFLGRIVFRLRFELVGLSNVPAGEPVIVAAAPHRNWIDPFLVVIGFPSVPRVYFLGSAEGMFNKAYKRTILRVVGGVVPVSTRGQLNREGLETSLAILRAGNSLGLMPEGWDQEDKPGDEIQPLRRGVAFLAARSARRTVPVGLAGTQELWRGKTLRIAVGRPIDPPPPDASREAELAFVDQVTAALSEVLPPLPPEPRDGRKPWPWLTRLLY